MMARCKQQAGGSGNGRRKKGFTLVEMVVTVLIAAVIIAFAVPSFRNMVISNRLTTAANDVVDAINTARVEAIKRNGNVQLCSNSSSLNTTDTLGSNCATNAGAVYGVSVDSSGATVVDQVRSSFTGIASPLKINGDFTALRFNGQGMGMKPGTTAPYGGTVLQICASGLANDNVRVVTLAAGSMVQVTTTTGTCT